MSSLAHRSEGIYSHVAASESLPVPIQEEYGGGRFNRITVLSLHIRTGRPEQTV